LRSNRSELPPDLADALARSRNRLGVFASNVLFFPTVESTNDVAAGRSPAFRRAEGIPGSPTDERIALREGAVVIADEQTAGRGRRGHAWFSPPGSGLYVSVVLTPARARDPHRATRLLTLAAGVALAEAIESPSGLRIDLKWPNDLYVGRRKLGGLLAEAQQHSPDIILGYGINVRDAAYPSEITDRATSIESELGRAIDRYALLVETLASLSMRYEDLVAGRFDAILDAWRRRAPAARGARVRWTTAGGPRAGVTAGIDDEGALLVQVEEHIERIVGGEVIWS
jgi:BirA family biotin operon repressor/biotin-[acetyl-CoA-carboxylase] ligase